MANLTDTQRDDFIAGLGVSNRIGLNTASREKQIDAGQDLAYRTDVVETHETYADFVKTHGRPARTVQAGAHELHIWDGVQFGKGKPRGSLYLMEFDSGVSASLFS